MVYCCFRWTSKRVSSFWSPKAVTKKQREEAEVHRPSTGGWVVIPTCDVPTSSQLVAMANINKWLNVSCIYTDICYQEWRYLTIRQAQMKAQQRLEKSVGEVGAILLGFLRVGQVWCRQDMGHVGIVAPVEEGNGIWETCFAWKLFMHFPRVFFWFSILSRCDVDRVEWSSRVQWLSFAFGNGVPYLVISLHFKMSKENKTWLCGL